jgi:hypothetical protein
VSAGRTSIGAFASRVRRERRTCSRVLREQQLQVAVASAPIAAQVDEMARRSVRVSASRSSGDRSSASSEGDGPTH